MKSLAIGTKKKGYPDKQKKYRLNISLLLHTLFNDVQTDFLQINTIC
ncbi:MAG: hypothetical protein KAK00_09560 [Nanoarchaeota archaeon]|nr:hypothetical protein [Nanoarchaeota archaeon]